MDRRAVEETVKAEGRRAEELVLQEPVEGHQLQLHVLRPVEARCQGPGDGLEKRGRK